MGKNKPPTAEEIKRDFVRSIEELKALVDHAGKRKKIGGSPMDEDVVSTLHFGIDGFTFDFGVQAGTEVAAVKEFIDHARIDNVCYIFSNNGEKQLALRNQEIKGLKIYRKLSVA